MKRFKKLALLLLAALIPVAGAPAPSARAEVDSGEGVPDWNAIGPHVETLFASDLEDVPVGSELPAGWTKYIQGTNSTVDVAELDGNRVIKLDRLAVGSEPSPGIVYSFGEPMRDGTMTVTFDVYRTAGQRMFAYALGSDLNFSNQPVRVFVDFNAHYTFNPTYRSVGPNSANQWYSYELKADLKSRTYELFIDGVRVTSAPVAFQTAADVTLFAIYNRFGRGGPNNANVQIGPYYVDNVEIRVERNSPEAVSPVNGAKGIEPPAVLEWRDANADHYTLVISETPDMKGAVRVYEGIAGTTFTLPADAAFEYERAYYWKAIAWRDGEAWSTATPQTFVTGSMPKESVHPHLDWEDAVGGEPYTVRVFKPSDPLGVLEFGPVYGSDFSVPVELSYGAAYRWQALTAGGDVAAEGEFVTVEEDGEPLYRSDFQAETVGSALPAGWEKYIVGTQSTAALAELADGNRVVQLDRLGEGSEASPGVIYRFGRTLTDGVLTVGFDVYRSSTQRMIAVMLGEDMNFNNNPVRLFFDYGQVYNALNSGWTSLGASEANRWYRIEIAADLKLRTYDVYIDGVKKTSVPSAFQSAYGVSQVAIYNRYGRGGENNTNVQVGPYYIDDAKFAFLPNAPSPVSPADSAEDVAARTTFTWADAGADSYTLVVSERPDFAEIVRYVRGIASTSYTLDESEALDFSKRYYWKVIASKGGKTWSHDGAPSFTTQLDETGDRVPAIFEMAPNPTGPGELVQLIGEKFDTGEVLVARLEDVSELELHATLGGETDAGALPTDGVLAHTVDWTDRVIRAVIPESMPYGTYAVWTRNGSKRSDPRLLNRTDAYFASPDRVNTAKSREVRVIGKNLSFGNGDETAYVYLRDGEGAGRPMSLTKVGPYELAFELPNDIGPGVYEVWVHNGHGGAYGWSKPLTVAVVHEEHPAYFNAADFGAKPGDEAPDREAIQGALDAAEAAGGGTVLVPSGTFWIDAALHVGENVVLKGEGPGADGLHRSIIRFVQGAPLPPAGRGLGPAMIHVDTGGGVEALKLVGSVSVDRGIVVEPGAEDVVIRGNDIDNHYPTSGIKGYYSGVFGSGANGEPFRRITIEDNTFNGYNGINFDGLEYSLIRNNTVYVRRYTPIVFSASSKNIIEGNRIDGRNTDGVREANRGITFNTGVDRGGLNPNEMNYLTGNLIEYVGNAVYPTNDGEYILFDNNGDSSSARTQFYGRVKEAGASDVTVEGAQWVAGQMEKLYVIVVEGKGLGQWRKVVGNDEDTLAVDKAWDAPPNHTSKLVVSRVHANNLVVGNTARNNKGNNFMLWGNVLGNVMDSNVAQEGGSVIAALDHSSHPNQYGAAYYNTIKNSSSPSVTFAYYEYGIGRVPRASRIMVGNTLRNNAAARIYFSNNTVQDPSGTLFANAIEGNRVSSAVIVESNADRSALFRNVVAGTAVKYDDRGSNTVIVEPPVPDVPSGASALPHPDGAYLAWEAVPDADGVFAFRSESPDGPFVLLNGGQPIAGTSYADREAAPGRLYYYKLASWTEQGGQSEASPVFAGFTGEGVYASSLDFADTHGYRQWSYADGSGPLAYADGRWTNAGGTVAVERHRAVVAGGEAIREWTAPFDGIVRYYGYAHAEGDAQGAADWAVRLNGETIEGRESLGDFAIDGEVDVRQGDVVRFAVANAQPVPMSAATEFAVHFTRDAPNPLAPQDGSRDVTLYPEFRWTAVPSAEQYVLVLDDDEDLSSPLFEEGGLTGTSYSLNEDILEPNRTYFWKVRAVSGGDAWETEQPAASFATTGANRVHLYGENYNDKTTGTVPPGYAAAPGRSGKIAVAEMSGRYSKALMLESPGDGSQPKASFDLPFALDSGKVDISWETVHTGHPSIHYSLFFGDGPVSFGGLFAAYGHYWVDWAAASPYISAVGERQHVRLAVDLDAGTYEAYLNGKQIVLNNGTRTFPLKSEVIRTITLQFYADRWQGSVAFDNITVLRVDDAAPVTSVTVTGATYGDWYTSPPIVSLAASDDVSVVASTYYALTDGEPMEFGGPFKLQQDGVHEIRYWSVDRARNAEAERREIVRVDLAGPAIEATANGVPLVEGVTFLDAEPVTLLASASDAASGVAQMSMYVDGQPAEPGVFDFAGRPGEYIVLVEAIDAAGHVSQRAWTIRIKTSVDSMLTLIDRYSDAGELDRPFSEQLRQRLDQVRHHLDPLDPEKAIEKMNAFVDFLETNPNQELIKEHAQKALLADAYALIDEWSIVY